VSAQAFAEDSVADIGISRDGLAYHKWWKTAKAGVGLTTGRNI
jgi:hypothetical protein